MSIRRYSKAAVLALSLAAWACGGQQDEPAAGTADTVAEETVPSEAPSATIVGRTLTTTVTAEEATADPGAAGTWELTLAEDGTFEVRDESAEPQVQGTYRIEGDRIVFTDASGPAMCDDPQGEYRWTMAGDQVSMTVVDDTCPGRLTVLTAHPLTLR
ncbi:MAG TPA: hypothetical protein VJP59_01440 [Gemmatimonadota bacterium]|nr:hypothetical protein [Gemmatimonadota bacterium]